jgi:hypothetical protein
MKFYFPYPSPFETAQCLSEIDLNSQIKAISSHKPYNEWLDRCRICFEYYAEGRMELARWWSSHADMVRPTDIDEKYCAADRAALYKKAPKRYERFKSEE